MYQTRRPRFWQASAGLLLLLIFALDASVRADIAISVLYVVPTILFVGGATFAEPLIVAAVATILIAAGFFLSPQSGPQSVALINRALSGAAVWAAAGLVVGYVRQVERWGRRMTAANESAEQSLRRLQDIEHALDQSAIVAATDQKGIITYVNDKFCEISKYPREELLGKDHRIINSSYHPKDVIKSLWRTIAQGQVWRGELRNRAKDGSIYWVDTTIVPFLDDRGKPWQYMSIRSDITQRKAAEEQLRHEAALTQLGRLSAVVAHEVRNPLAALRGSLQILSSRLPADLPGREIIQPMLVRIDTLNRTVQDILTYAKPSPPKLQRFNVTALAGEVAAAARAAAPASQVEVTGEPVVVHLDPEMVRAALLNLLLNACQAGGPAPVEVQVTADVRQCRITILDRGPGLPADMREHLFEPFITNKPGGTGLGLPIALRLIQLQGGTLQIDDRPGGGTAVSVGLPALVSDSVR